MQAKLSYEFNAQIKSIELILMEKSQNLFGFCKIFKQENQKRERTIKRANIFTRKRLSNYY